VVDPEEAPNKLVPLDITEADPAPFWDSTSGEDDQNKLEEDANSDPDAACCDAPELGWLSRVPNRDEDIPSCVDAASVTVEEDADSHPDVPCFVVVELNVLQGVGNSDTLPKDCPCADEGV